MLGPHIFHIAAFGNQPPPPKWPILRATGNYPAPTTGQPVRVTDVEADPQVDRKVDVAPGYAARTLLSMPVRCGAVIVAVATLLGRPSHGGPGPGQRCPGKLQYAAVRATLLHGAENTSCGGRSHLVTSCHGFEKLSSLPVHSVAGFHPATV